MRTPKPREEPRKPDGVVVIGDLLVRYGAVLAKWAGIAFIACLAYFIYAIYGGVLQSADPARAYYLVSMFGKGLTLSAFLLAVGLVLMTLEEVSYAILVGIGGLAVMLGVPYMVASNLSAQSLPQGLEGVVRQLSSSGSSAGGAMLFVVGVRILYEIFVQIKEAPARRQAYIEKQLAEDSGALKKHKTLKPPTVLSRCWELPFCHERVREICPAFQHRRTCWRYGIGCNCDPKLIESLIRMGTPGSGKASSAMKGRQAAYIRSDLEADVQLRSKAERTIPCSKCPIYNEHQRLKFKFVNPIAVLATIIILGLLYKPITAAWGLVAGGIVTVASNITLRSGFDAGSWFKYLQDDVVKVFFFIIVSLLTLSYTLKFTEWAVLQRKI